MENQSEAKLLRIFISSIDKFKHKPLYEVIVYAAKRYRLSGATVIKGFMGFGSANMVYSQKLWEITEKIPVIVEIIDESEKIDKFTEIIMPYFDKVKNGGMITSEKANIILHKK
jgi:PII-like signaling protein